jgi:hypothetical protein
MNITNGISTPSTISAIIDIVKPHNLFISVIHSCLNSNNGKYYLIATSNVKSLDLSQLQRLGASNGKVTIKFLDDLPPRYATKVATNSFRKNGKTISNEQLEIPSTGDITIDLPSRMDHILTLLLDVQHD